MTPARPRRLRVGVVGLAHYHVTGWVETLEGFADELEIVALYDADPERGANAGSATPRSVAVAGARRSIPRNPIRDRPRRPDRPARARRRTCDPAERRRSRRHRPPRVGRNPPAGRQACGTNGGGAPRRRRSGRRVGRPVRRRADPPLRAGGADGTRAYPKRTARSPRHCRGRVRDLSVAVRDPANALFDRASSGGGIRAGWESTTSTLFCGYRASRSSRSRR